MGKLKTKDILRNFSNRKIGIKCVYRIACTMFSAMLLLYARWSVMGGTRPEFNATDNPTAFSDNIFTKVHKKERKSNFIFL